MPRPHDPRALLFAMREAVVLATTVTRRVQADLTRVQTMLKADKSPVTVADLASQAIVARVLEARFPEIPLVAEEDSAPLEGAPLLAAEVLEALREVWPDAREDDVLRVLQRGQADPAVASAGFFTLDPVDGTKGFLRGGHYAVALAFLLDGVVEAAALGCPGLGLDRARPVEELDPRGRLFFAARGAGAFEVSASLEPGSPIALSLPRRMEGAVVRLAESVEAAHTKQDASRALIERLGAPVQVHRLDSQAKYAVVARGQADVYLRLPTRRGYVERIWDHAAGARIAAEVGLSVSDIRGAPLDFTAGRGLEHNLGVLVAHPALSERIIEALSDFEPAALL